MKKYLFIAIPIIILIIIVVTYIWIYPSIKNDDVYPQASEVISEIPESNDEKINDTVEEITTSSENIIENVEVIEKEETTVAKEDTSSKETTTTSSTIKSTTTKKNTSTDKMTSNNKNVASNQNTSKKETKVENATKEKTTQNTQPSSTNKQDSTIPTENKSEEIKKETVVRCTTNNNHGMGVGNSGKWFATKDEAISYYKSQIKYWDEWWQKADPNDTEADATYYKSCPTGYEIWSCMYCSKWTINFYYR